ncbi:MAG TPA: GAF domain-containing protein, partial [Cytophagaceae bacterium]|nr:GAF domain-containing protein [Cytophagaceae bacterium]
MISYQLVNKSEIQQYKEEIDRLNGTILHAAEFISEIGKGNLEADYKSDSENDILRTALLSMKSQLKKIADQEKNHAWANKGLALFAELMRIQYVNLNDFSYAIISNLVKYLNANQGGVFILTGENEGKPLLEMYASYAYDKKKYNQKIIRPGQGLLGQAFLEKESIYITEIPDQYTTVTSGLGASTPSVVMIVPLKYNDVVVGILEVASFNKFEKFELEFAEKIAQSMGAAVTSIKINERTEKLLYETREQTESLKSQEEEMRQNLEELQSTQEKSESMESDLRMNKEMLEQKLLEHDLENKRMLEYMDNYKQILIEVLDELPLKIFIKDDQGKFILVNTAVANAHNISIEKLLNTSDFDYFSEEQASNYRKQELDIIKDGKPVVFYHEETVNGKKKVLKTM